MSLCDELPPKQDLGAFSRIDHAAHQEIDSHIAEYLARGGKITTVDFGATANTDCLPLLINEFSGEASMHETRVRLEGGKKGAHANGRTLKKIENHKMGETFLLFDGKNRSKQRSKHGENIRKKRSKDCYFVEINGVDYYSKDDLTHEQAIIKRDELREKMGMSPASY